MHTEDRLPCARPRLPVGLQPTDLFRGEGRDPYVPRAPAFAGADMIGCEPGSALAEPISRTSLNTTAGAR